MLHGGYLLLAAAFNSDTASFLEKIKKETAALISQKPPFMNRRAKIPLLYDGFFSFAVVRQIDFIIIKERADNSRLEVLLAIGSASVRLAL